MLRRVGKMISKPMVAARRSPIHGTGVFALRRIARGTRIIEYLGQRVPWARCKDKARGHTELFHVSATQVIDPRRGGNIARFINHSCSPNCVAYLEEGRVFIYARRTIEPGEELFYDYQLALGRRPTKADVLRHRCRCTSRRCRGTLLAIPPSRRRQARRWALEATA